MLAAISMARLWLSGNECGKKSASDCEESSGRHHRAYQSELWCLSNVPTITR